jgi:hypothetical protein
MPIAAFQAAIIAYENQWGLLNALSFPTWLNVLIAVVLLDLIIYLQHLVSIALNRCGNFTACIMQTWISMSQPEHDSTR